MTMEFAEGAPTWVDLGSPDLAATVEFYRQLFGWEAEDQGEETGNYTIFRAGGKQIGAAGPLYMEGQRSAWTVYFKSSDVDGTAKAVESAGGTVRMPPMDVLDQTRIAQFTDPLGAEFGTNKLLAHKGMEVWGAENTVVWIEYFSRDVQRSMDFYSEVYGWTTADSGMPGVSYTLLKASGADQEFGGAMQMDENFPPETPAYWVPYFAVADVDAIAAKATDLGGSIHMPPTDVPQVGRLASLSDQNGAMFSILKPDPQM